MYFLACCYSRQGNHRHCKLISNIYSIWNKIIVEKYNIHRYQMHFEIHIQFQFNSLHFLLNYFSFIGIQYTVTRVELIPEAFNVKGHRCITSHHHHQQHNLYPLILQTASNIVLQSQVNSFPHLTLSQNPADIWEPLQYSCSHPDLESMHTHKPLYLCSKWLNPLTGFVSHSSAYYHVLPVKGKWVMRSKREGIGNI